jgi:aspartate dehydrogenase
MKPSTSSANRRVALIGFGALGHAIATELQAGHIPGVAFHGALVPAGSSHADLEGAWHCVDDLLAAAPDLVVEAAGHAALGSHAAACLRAGCDLVAASVGALMDQGLRDRLWDAARAGRSRLIVPSGALGGLDYLRAAHRAGHMQVQYRGCKPVNAWRNTAAETLVDLGAIRQSTTFFRGNAEEAARKFPQNANVVAALALAVGDPDAVRVELVADPGASANSHHVEARGDAGTIRLSVENLPLPANPKTSRVTAYSILDAIAMQLGAEAR